MNHSRSSPCRNRTISNSWRAKYIFEFQLYLPHGIAWTEWLIVAHTFQVSHSFVWEEESDSSWKERNLMLFKMELIVSFPLTAWFDFHSASSKDGQTFWLNNAAKSGRMPCTCHRRVSSWTDAFCSKLNGKNSMQWVEGANGFGTGPRPSWQ